MTIESRSLGAAGAAALLAMGSLAAATAEISSFCWKQIDVSCGNLHLAVNNGRVCRSGATASSCPDLLVGEDVNVPDIRNTLPGEPGRRGTGQSQAVHVQIQERRCNGSACVMAELKQKVCVGTIPSGPSCSGASSPPDDQDPGR